MHVMYLGTLEALFARFTIAAMIFLISAIQSRRDAL